MTAGSGDEGTPAAPGRGHLRASHADRERVVGTLKAAFVQGRLTKEELDARVGQAFVSRTYGELAAPIADLPAGLADKPRTSPVIRARKRPPMRKVIAGTVLVVPPPVMVGAAILVGSDAFSKVAVAVAMAFFMAWMVAGVQLLVTWHDRRAQGQQPPKPTQPRRAIERERDTGTGDDLVFCEARRAVRARRFPGRAVIRRTSVVVGS